MAQSPARCCGVILVPLRGRGCVREDRVVGSVQAVLIFVCHVTTGTGCTASHDNRGVQPIHNVLVKERYVFVVVGVHGIVLFGGGSIRCVADQSRQWVANGFVTFWLAVIRIVSVDVVLNAPGEDKRTQRIGNGFSIQRKVLLGECPGNTTRQRVGTGLVPIG